MSRQNGGRMYQNFSTCRHFLKFQAFSYILANSHWHFHFLCQMGPFVGTGRICDLRGYNQKIKGFIMTGLHILYSMTSSLMLHDDITTVYFFIKLNLIWGDTRTINGVSSWAVLLCLGLNSFNFDSQNCFL